MKDIELAWRNLWRNKRRTLITSASVFFAIFFALVMRSFQLGAYDRLFMNVVESYSGFIQLQDTNYIDEPILDNAFILDSGVEKNILADRNVIAVVPRLESFMLASSGSRTRGVIVLGIDPGGEEMISGVSDRLVKYKLHQEAAGKIKESDIPGRVRELLDVFTGESYSSEGRMMLDLGISLKDSSIVLPLFRRYAAFSNHYLDSGDPEGILVGNGLSDYLEAYPGDTIVLAGQGYHGTSAFGKYIIRGVVKLPAPDIDNVIVYMPIESARGMFSAGSMSTSAVINVKNNDDDDVTGTAARIRTIISKPMVVRTWREINSLLVNQMEADNRSGAIMIGILYLVIAFGVFGTVLMMMAERRREFGMLVSVGMQKKRLAKVVSLEMLFLGFIGITSGAIASLPIVYYGYIHPIRFTGELGKMYEDYGFEPVMPTMLPDSYYLWQVLVVVVILLIAITFIIRKVLRMNPINSLRA
jgi:ABC-type lipoprotein release transport system permease subunit